MDVNQLQMVEQLCQKLYQSPSAEERHEAEVRLAQFTSSLAYVQHLRHILDFSNSPYARMFACFRFGCPALPIHYPKISNVFFFFPFFLSCIIA